MVLVGPQSRFSTFNLTKSIRSPLFAGGVGKALPTLIVWSTEDKKSNRDAQVIYDLLEKSRPELPEFETAEEKLAATTLFKARLEDLNWTGADLLTSQRVEGLWNYIARTVSDRIKVDIEKHAWSDRSGQEVE